MYCLIQLNEIIYVQNTQKNAWSRMMSHHILPYFLLAVSSGPSLHPLHPTRVEVDSGHLALLWPHFALHLFHFHQVDQSPLHSQWFTDKYDWSKCHRRTHKPLRSVTLTELSLWRWELTAPWQRALRQGMALGEGEGHRERKPNQTLPLSYLCLWLHWLGCLKLLPIIK